MSTKHVILALLDIAPMSGYDLAHNMKISIESLWSATYSQIYPTLHKLTAEGCIEATDMTGETKRKRIVYHLTETGRTVLQTWINQPVHYLPFRDPFKLWSSYLEECEPEIAFANIDHHIQINAERATYFEQIVAAIEDESHPLIQARKESVSAEKLTKIKRSRALIFRELAIQAANEVASAKRIRAYAEQFL